MPSNEFTVDALKRILLEGAGEPDGEAAIGRETLDTDFADIGYDSVALLETSGRIEREFGVRLDEEQLSETHTPRELIGLVNDQMAG